MINTERSRRSISMGNVSGGLKPRDSNGFEQVSSWTVSNDFQPQAPQSELNALSAPTVMERSFKQWANVQESRTAQELRALINNEPLQKRAS